jgi:hypothetical protein
VSQGGEERAGKSPEERGMTFLIAPSQKPTHDDDTRPYQRPSLILVKANFAKSPRRINIAKVNEVRRLTYKIYAHY